MPAIALYYPWMHFQDDNWLKLALLTWDRIVRVRPKVLDDRDGELVRRLRSDSDLIVEATPSETDLAMVGELFTEILDTHRDSLVQRYGRSSGRWSPEYMPPESQVLIPQTNAYVGYRLEPRLLWVYHGDHGSKVDSGLRDLLVGNDLAVDEPTGRPWLGVIPKLGSIYLAALADAMARNNSLCPATDDPRMHNAVGALDRLTGLLLDEPAPAVPDPHSAYVHLALRAVLEPENLAAVPIATLITFRQRHAAELTAFREHVAGLATELATVVAVENLQVAQAHLAALYETTTKPLLDELRKALRGHGVSSAAGVVGLKVDLNAAAGTVLGGVAAMAGQPLVAGAAVAVTVVPYLAGRFRALRHTVRDSPVAYLLAADRKLTGRSLLAALR